MGTPLISVILATYNGSRFLAEAIESVLSQEYPNFELIIIDDASTDQRVREIVETYIKNDDRIQYERNIENQERSWSKNRWVELARGEYISFIDDDDIWDWDKLTGQLKFLEKNPDIGIVGTWARFVDESGLLIGISEHLNISPETIEKSVLITNPFIQSSVLLRKDYFLATWGFPDFNLCEDYDLWLRILQMTRWANIPETLVTYRVRSTSTTSKNFYRMKWMTLQLIWKYRKKFPGFSQAFFFRTITFPFHIPFLLSVWKKIIRKGS